MKTRFDVLRFSLFVLFFSVAVTAAALFFQNGYSSGQTAVVANSQPSATFSVRPAQAFVGEAVSVTAVWSGGGVTNPTPNCGVGAAFSQDLVYDFPNNSISFRCLYTSAGVKTISMTGVSGTTPTGSGAVTIVAAPAVGNAPVIPSGATVFDKPGTFSWTAPSGVTKVSVWAWGGGGAGASADPDYPDPGAGGAGGGFGGGEVSVTPGTKYEIVVGKGGDTQVVAYGRDSGVGGGLVTSAAYRGEQGGNSKFGDLVVARGGEGGANFGGELILDVGHGAGASAPIIFKGLNSQGTSGGRGAGGGGAGGILNNGGLVPGGGGGANSDWEDGTITMKGGDGKVVIKAVESAPVNDYLPVTAVTSPSCGGKIELSWTKATPANSKDAVGYIIYRLDKDPYSVAELSYETIKIRDINMIKYTDTTPALNTKYWYYVFPATASELALELPVNTNAAGVILAQQSVSRGYSGSQVFQTFGAASATDSSSAVSSAACAVPNPDLTPAPNTPTVSDGEVGASYVNPDDKLTYFIPGKKAKIDGGVLNIGTGVVSAGKHFNVRFQKSESQTFDPTNVGVVDVVAPAGGLLKDGKISLSYNYTSVTADDGKTYYFRYCVDQPPTDDIGSVVETQGANDALVSPAVGEYNNCSGDTVIKFKPKPLPEKPVCDCNAINSSLTMPQSLTASAAQAGALVIAANAPNITGSKNIDADNASVIKLVWSSTGAETVSLFKVLLDGTKVGGNLITSNLGSGEISLTNLTVGEYDYVFTATNLGGECVSTVHFNIIPAPPPNPDLIPNDTPDITGPAGSTYTEGSGDIAVTYFIPGTTLTLKAQPKNKGPGNVPLGSTFNVKFQAKLHSEAESSYNDLTNIALMSPPFSVLIAGAAVQKSPTDQRPTITHGTNASLTSLQEWDFRYCVDMPPNDYAGKVVEKQSVYTNVNNNDDKTKGVGEYNNCSGATTIKLKPKIPPPVPKNPDLIISIKPAISRFAGAVGPLYVGEQLIFNATVKNQGELAASNIFYNRFQILREDKTVEATIGEPTLPSLAVGGTEVVTSNSWTAVAGTYRVVACADTSNTSTSHNKINEGDKEGNNCSPSDAGAGGTTIKVEKPDLTPLGALGTNDTSLPNAPVPSGTTFTQAGVTYYRSGTKVTFTAEPKNIGGTFTTPSFNVKLQVKDAAHPDTVAGDAFYVDRGTASISGGIIYNQSKTATIEETSGATETKAFKYRYCADLPPNENQTGDPTGFGVIAESNENNNCSGPVVIRYGLPNVPPPTLTLKVRKAGVEPYTHDLLTVDDGDRIDLAWNYTGTSACTASWKTPSAISAVDADLSVGPLRRSGSPYTYTVTCGALSDKVTVNVKPPVITEKLSCVLDIRPFKATGTFGKSVIIFSGEEVELQWRVTGANSVSLFKLALGSKVGENLVVGNNPSGIVKENGLSVGQYQYKLTATDTAGVAQNCSVDVLVNSAPKPDLVPLNPPSVTGPRNAGGTLISGKQVMLHARAENIGGSRAGKFDIKFQHKPAGQPDEGQPDESYEDFKNPDGTVNFATVSGGLGAKIKLASPVSIEHISRLDESGTYDFRYCVDMPPDNPGLINETQISESSDRGSGVGEFNNCSESSRWSFGLPPPPPPPTGCAPNCPITPPPSSGPLSVTCSVSPSRQIDLATVSSATWTATPLGGDSPYTFEWLAGGSGNSFDGYTLPHSTGDIPSLIVNYAPGGTLAKTGTARGSRSGKVTVTDSSTRTFSSFQSVSPRCGEPKTTSSPVSISSDGSLSATCSVSATSTDALGREFLTWTANIIRTGTPPYSYLWKKDGSPEQGMPTASITMYPESGSNPPRYAEGHITVTDSAMTTVSEPKTETADCGTVNVFNSNDDYEIAAGPTAILNFIGETASSNRVPITIRTGWFDQDIVISASPDTLDDNDTLTPYLFYSFYKNGVFVGSTVTLNKDEYAAGLEMVVKATKFIPAKKYPNAITVHSVGGGKSHDAYVNLYTNDSRPTFQNF